jgi:hypothetical protein
MIYNKMTVLVPKYPINRWDKDSIRPGPVGSVGDVNMQVKLKKSAPDMKDRYDPTFSGKNEPWSGSNVSDGMWYGWTSGGREATVISKALPNIQDRGKTAVGWVMQNIVPTDRSRVTKVTPLGRYGWDTTVGSVLKAKTTGELFLPLPEGYNKTELPRGSGFPRIIASSTGAGVALPAADVKITDPVFGETGSIEVPVPGSNICKEIRMDYTWTPAMDDPLRSFPPPKSYPYRYAFVKNNQTYYDENRYPDIGEAILVVDIDHGYKHYNIRTDPCGGQNRMAKDQPKMKLPLPGNQDKRREDKRREDDKNKKQKMR